jgi:mannose-1-phosphate guanylyltransferase
VSPRPAGQGSVGLGPRGTVVRLRRRSFADEVSGADYVGVCAVGAECLESLPARGCLIGDWAIPRLAEGEVIHTVCSDDPWTDAGDLPSYLAANRDWLRTRAESSYCGPDAEVSPQISLEGSVVGAGARIEGSGLVADCVVWPGARVRAPLARRIVMSDGRQVPVPA